MNVFVDLNAQQVEEAMHRFIAIESDDPDEDEAFRRMVGLFNTVYRWGQEEALRVVARGKNAE